MGNIAAVRHGWLRNWQTKLGALLLSIFLWFHVVTDKIYEVEFKVPIEVVNVPKDLVIAESEPTQGTVKLIGNGKQLILAKLKGSSIKVRISVASGKLGDLSYVVLPTDVELPDETYVNVVDIVAPAEVKVRLDSFMEKKVKVVHQVAIDPAPMHTQVGSVELRPDSVLVRGPRSYARGITEAKLKSVKLSNVESKLKMVVPISSENRHNITYVPDEVEVVVDIQEIAERLISGVPMELRGFPEHLRLVPNPPKVDLKVSGGAEILALLDADDFSAYIGYSDYLRAKEAGSSEVSPSFDLPSEVKLLKTTPEKFTLIRSFGPGPTR